MKDRRIGIRVTITRYVSEEPQPGLVECLFDDAFGQRWVVLDKTVIVSNELIDAQSQFS